MEIESISRLSSAKAKLLFACWEEIKMASKKTSAKPRASSKKAKMPALGRVRAGVKTYPHDPASGFRDIESVKMALAEAFFEGDEEALKDIIRGYYQVLKVDAALKKN